MAQFVQGMSIGVLVLIAGVLLAGVLLNRGRPTDPLAIFLQGWGLGLASVLRRPFVFLGLGLITFFGLGLDIVFAAAPDLRPDPDTLMVVGLSWRVASAGLIAALVFAHHRGVYGELDGIDYPTAAERPNVEGRVPGMLLMCVVVGVFVALLLIGAEFLFSWVMGQAGVGEAFAGYYGASMFVFVVTATLGLLRPAIAYGEGVGAGLATALRNFLSLIVVTALIALPLVLVAVAAPMLAEVLFRGPAMRAIMGAGVLAGFTVLQLLALEAALAAFYLRTRRTAGAGPDESEPRAVPRAA